MDVGLEELAELRCRRIASLILPSTTVLDDSIGCAQWFAARGRGQLVQPDGRLRPYTSPARVIENIPAKDTDKKEQLFRTKSFDRLRSDDGNLVRLLLKKGAGGSTIEENADRRWVNEDKVAFTGGADGRRSRRAAGRLRAPPAALRRRRLAGAGGRNGNGNGAAVAAQPGPRQPCHRRPRPGAASALPGRIGGGAAGRRAHLVEGRPAAGGRRGRQADTAGAGPPARPGADVDAAQEGHPVRLAHRQSRVATRERIADVPAPRPCQRHHGLLILYAFVCSSVTDKKRSLSHGRRVPFVLLEFLEERNQFLWFPDQQDQNLAFQTCLR